MRKKGRINMEAKYFRLMYQNVNKGMVHTVSVEDTIKKCKFTAFYLSGSKKLKNSLVTDERFSCCKETIQLMVLAELDTDCLQKALEIIEANALVQVVMPDCAQETIDIIKSAGAEKVLVLKDGESMEPDCDIWQVSLKCYGEGRNASIVMFHGSEHLNPQIMDCVLNVKPVSKRLPCKVCVDSKNLSCDMSCGLYNDFDICKGHNAKSRNNYLTGTLLLGSVDLKTYGNQIQKDFEEFRRYIRFTSIPESCKSEDWKDMMDWLDEENKVDKKYFIPPSNEKGNEKILKNVLEKGPHRIPLLTSESFGICVSGFYTKRK